MKKEKNLKPLKSKKAKRRARKGFLAAVFLVLLSVLTILCLTVFFPINEILVEYNSKLYSSKEIIEASDIEIGDNIIMLSSKKIENKISEKLPFIDRVEVKKKFDKVVLIPKNTSAHFCIKSDEKYIVLDKNFKVLEEIKNRNKKLTYLKGLSVKKYKTGTIVEFKNPEKFEYIKTINNVITKYDFKINEIDIKSKADIKVKINSKFEVLFGTGNMLDEKLAFLVKTIQQIENKNMNDTGVINLKYFEEKKEGYFKSTEIK